MKKFIKDEINIKDIINHVDLNKVLYEGTLSVGNPAGNVIVLQYDNKTVLDLAELNGLNYFDNEYIVLSISESVNGVRYIYLKQIPMI